MQWPNRKNVDLMCRKSRARLPLESNQWLWYSLLIAQALVLQCEDNAMEWDIESLCQKPDFPVWQHYKVTMIAHCHKLDPILIWPYLLQGCKTPTTNLIYDILFQNMELVEIDHSKKIRQIWIFLVFLISVWLKF